MDFDKATGLYIPGTKIQKPDIQLELAGIWKDVLKLEALNVNDNFFDLDGDSLHAVDLQTAVEKTFGQKVNVNAILTYPTVASYAKFLEGVELKNNYKSLVPIKSTGNKMPLYIIHGSGYNLTNFVNLAACLDAEQPLYSLQPLGMDGKEEPYDSMEEIARFYVSEILKHNADGPYALAGYSFGGYVAIEMKRQMEGMGKTIKFIGVSDTDAGVLPYKKKGLRKFPKKVLRQFPKAVFITRSFFNNPSETYNYQKTFMLKKLRRLFGTTSVSGIIRTDTDLNLDKISLKQQVALNKYVLKPFSGQLHLFKAQKRLYFVDEFKYLGWKKFALDGVVIHQIPGDHRTMFLHPHVEHLAAMIQAALDNC